MMQHHHRSKSASGGERNKLRQICLRYEKEILASRDYMFWFLIFWTTSLLLLEWLNFFGRLERVPEAMASGYIILLGAYILHKEVGRWADIKTKVRHGEVFVYIWWGTFLTMFLASIFREEYEIPHNMPMLSYEVLGYFIFSEVSKSINKWRRQKQNEK